MICRGRHLAMMVARGRKAKADLQRTDAVLQGLNNAGLRDDTHHLSKGNHTHHCQSQAHHVGQLEVEPHKEVQQRQLPGRGRKSIDLERRLDEDMTYPQPQRTATRMTDT